MNWAPGVTNRPGSLLSPCRCWFECSQVCQDCDLHSTVRKGLWENWPPPRAWWPVGMGLPCWTHVLPITPFCILPLLVHSKQNYCVYIVYCNILQKYYHKLHCRVYYNIRGKSVVNRNSAHQIHKISYFLGKWGAGWQKERRCLSPACDVYFTHYVYNWAL